jgi:hypothetical protein
MDEKIGALTKHIASNGIDPTELPLVLKHPEKNNRYIVTEGNRRLLALKLFSNPDLCPKQFPALKKKIKLLHNTYQANIPKKLQCSVVSNRKEAYPWVDLKHTGENEGSGRVQWDGRATDTFRQKTGNKKTAGRIMLDYIEDDPDFDNSLKEYAKSLPITNLTRLFGASEAKTSLGYKLKENNLELASSINKFRTGVEAVIHRFQEDKIKVASIYDTEDRKKFFEQRISPESLPDKDDIGKVYKKIDLSKSIENTTKEKKQGRKLKEAFPQQI